MYHKRPVFIKIHGNSRKELFFNITKIKLKYNHACSGFF